jgi:hypothetical protein
MWSGVMAEHAVTDLPATPRVPLLGPHLAAGAVALVSAGSGIRLDYSPRSLAVVDRVIDGMRRAGGGPAAGDAGARVLRALTGFGAYTGEVLVRAVGATWVDFDPEERAMFGEPIGVRTPDGRLWNPLGKAVKRYENGPADSLRLFCLSVGARS